MIQSEREAPWHDRVKAGEAGALQYLQAFAGRNGAPVMHGLVRRMHVFLFNKGVMAVTRP
jgi:hypothetical protein